MRSVAALFVLCCALSVKGQRVTGLDTTGGAMQADLYVRRLSGDSLVSSFCIVIKKEVKPHRHLRHSEHVYVLEGSGRMRLGEETFDLAPGDLIFIPANTVHGVVRTGKKPLKVLSLQAPHFDGTDRVME